MFLNVVNKKEIDTSLKKTRPTQENEENSNSGNEKQGIEKDNQLFNYYKATENNNGEHSQNNIRKDFYGIPIVKKGKQKVTFIDKIGGKNFEDVVKIESYKDYNKTEEVKTKHVYNNCCLLV